MLLQLFHLGIRELPEVHSGRIRIPFRALPCPEHSSGKHCFQTFRCFGDDLSALRLYDRRYSSHQCEADFIEQHKSVSAVAVTFFQISAETKIQKTAIDRKFDAGIQFCSSWLEFLYLKFMKIHSVQRICDKHFSCSGIGIICDSAVHFQRDDRPRRIDLEVDIPVVSGDMPCRRMFFPTSGTQAQLSAGKFFRLEFTSVDIAPSLIVFLNRTVLRNNVVDFDFSGNHHACGKRQRRQCQFDFHFYSFLFSLLYWNLRFEHVYIRGKISIPGLRCVEDERFFLSHTAVICDNITEPSMMITIV